MLYSEYQVLRCSSLSSSRLVLGSDAVLLNTAIAGADDPIAMAEAMKYGIMAGRLAYKAGRIPRKLYATASSPIEGML